MTKARVLPVPPSRCRPSTTLPSSERSCLEIALRACGRFNETTVMLPLCGAGTLEIFSDDWSALYHAGLPLSHCLAAMAWRAVGRGTARTMILLVLSAPHEEVSSKLYREISTSFHQCLLNPADPPRSAPAKSLHFHQSRAIQSNCTFSCNTFASRHL